VHALFNLKKHQMRPIWTLLVLIHYGSPSYPHAADAPGNGPSTADLVGSVAHLQGGVIEGRN
jgi:hypothetical protein